ncbi:MAG: N-acetylmuramoyl-L-alanine amidase, partial [Clostridia bacterium]|nr:N-acetylmuramoyl-L-alanine amidase [Clostridia bacterium]
MMTLIPSGVAPVFAEIADIEDSDIIAETQVKKYLSAKTTVETGSTQELMTAVSAHCDYKVVMVNGEYSADGVDDGKMLTDLVFSYAKTLDTGKKGAGWVRMKSKNGSDYTATVTLDLGFLSKDICRLYVRAYRNSQFKCEMPKKISFYVSSDGYSFYYMGVPTTKTDVSEDNSSAEYILDLDTKTEARYIRAVMECNGSNELWINEVGAAAIGNTFSANYDASGLIRDYQGLVYRINNGVAEVFAMESEPIGKYGELTPSKLSFDADDKTYYLGIGSDNEVKVTSDFIGMDKINYSGIPNNIQYIVIHNTATVEEETTAERYNQRMHNMGGESSWHYTVDDKEIYHSLTDSIAGFHAGPMQNYQSIGIEICVNGAPRQSANNFILSGAAYDSWVENRFRKSMKNAAVLTAELLTRYGLSTDAVIQHYDVTHKDCPLWMRANNGALWKEFLGYVEEYYKLFNGTSPTPVIRPQSNIVIPDYIRLNNGDIYPVSIITDDAFADRSEILKSVYLGKYITYVAQGCFNGNPLLERIIISSENDNFVTKDGCLIYDNDENLIFNPEEMPCYSEPNPKSDCTLDIREINGKNYIFDKGFGKTVGYYSDNYGAKDVSAVNFNGTKLSTFSQV